MKPARQETLLDLIEAQNVSGRPFLSFERQGVSVSADEFKAKVRRYARGLRQLGVKSGDRVMGFLDNGPASASAWFAAMSIGAIWVPINTALRGRSLTHVMTDCSPSVLFVESDLIETANAIGADVRNIRHVIAVNEARQESLSYEITFPEADVIQLESFESAEPLDDLHVAEPGDIACIIYTSGTTGASKGCMLPHNYIANLSRCAFFDRQPDEDAHTALPLFHLNAMTSVVVTLMIGGHLTVGHRFSVSGFWDSIEKSKAQFVSLLGPMAAMIATAPDTDAMKRCYGQLRKVLSSPFPEEVRRVFRERFGVREVGSVGGYGMTEAAPITWTMPGKVENMPGNASGIRTEFFDVEIVDDDDQILPPNSIGEVVCRPKQPNIMSSGYWGQPEATLKVTKNLWFHTGDLGRFDDDGFFYFVDRKKDYLRRRGENISSMEVEEIFRGHSDVLEVAVYGVPSEVGEDDVQLSAVLRDGAQVTEEELCQWSVDQLPYFAVPRYIEFRESLPKSAVGRIVKAELRARGSGYPRWDREDSSIDVRRRRG